MCLLVCDPAGTRAAQLAPRGSPSSALPVVVPLVYVAGLCAGAAALGSAPSLPVHLKTHKIEGSCKFTATCPGSCPVLPCWRSPGPFPGVLPTAACSECSPTSLGCLKAWHPPVKPDHDIPRWRNPLRAGRGCPYFLRPGSGTAWGSKSRKREMKGEQRESRMGMGWMAAVPGRPPAAAVRNEVTF